MTKSQTIQNWINNNQINNIDVLSDQQLSDFYDTFIELLSDFTKASKLHPSDDSYIHPNDVLQITLDITNSEF
jgi:hypothetical protein